MASANFKYSSEVKKISLSIMGMDDLLEEWYEKQKALQKGELNQEEYYEWKMN